jgi:hypothetical protein
MSGPTFQERLDWLAHGDVAPVLFATDTHYSERLTVDVMLVDPATVAPGGYASIPVFSKQFAYDAESVEPDQVAQYRAETLVEFGHRLRSLLIKAGQD